MNDFSEFLMKNVHPPFFSRPPPLFLLSPLFYGKLAIPPQIAILANLYPPLKKGGGMTLCRRTVYIIGPLLD